MLKSREHFQKIHFSIFITVENRALPKKQISLILPHPEAQTCARISEQQIVPLANTLTKMLPLGVSLTSEFKLEPREQPKFDYRVIQPKPNSFSAWRWRQRAQPTLFLSKPSVYSGFFLFLIILVNTGTKHSKPRHSKAASLPIYANISWHIYFIMRTK